jgi:hypothetical protein
MNALGLNKNKKKMPPIAGEHCLGARSLAAETAAGSHRFFSYLAVTNLRSPHSTQSSH